MGRTQGGRGAKRGAQSSPQAPKAKPKKAEVRICDSCGCTCKERDFHPSLCGCLRCHVGVTTGMGLEWNAETLEEIKSTPEKATKLKAITDRLEQIEDGNEDQLPTFNPPSEVQSQHTCGEYQYVEVLFVSPEQLERWCPAPYHTLGLHLAERFAEDNTTIISGFYIRADDIPKEMSWQEFQGLRKVRFYKDTSALHTSQVLAAEAQIGESQGNDLVSMLQRHQAQRDPDRPKVPNFARMPSIRSIQAKHLQNLEKKRLVEQKIAKQIQEQTPHPAADGGDAPQEAVVDKDRMDKLKRFAIGAAEATPSAASASQLAAQNKRRKKEKADKADKEKDKAESVGSVLQSDGGRRGKQPGTPSEASRATVHIDLVEHTEIRKRLAHDPAMMSVALHLSAMPVCLLQLSIPQAMAGAKLGVQTSSAKRLLPSMGDSSEATTLRKRIGLVEAVQELVQCRDLSRMPDDDRQKFCGLLAANDIEPSAQLKAKIISAAAARQARTMMASRALPDLQAYLDIVLPFSQSECVGFNYFEPTMNCAVLETLGSGMEQAFGETLALVRVEPEDLAIVPYQDAASEGDPTAPKVEAKSETSDDWQVLAEGFMRCVSPLVRMLELASSDASSVGFFLRVVVSLLKGLDSEFGTLGFSVPDSFLQAMNSTRKFCRCIVCLLSPIPRYLDSSAALVEEVARARGDQASEFLLQELKDALRTVPFWKEKVVEANKVASADTEAHLMLEDCMSNMRKASNVVQLVEAVKAGMQVKEEVETKIREGGLQELEAMMVAKLLEIVDGIIDTDAEAATGCVDCEWVTATLSALPVANDDVPDKLIRLTKWKEDNIMAMTHRELQEIDEKCKQSSSALDVEVREIQRLCDLLPDPTEHKTMLWRLSSCVLKTVADKAVSFTVDGGSYRQEELRKDLISAKRIMEVAHHPHAEWIDAQLQLHTMHLSWQCSLHNIQTTPSPTQSHLNSFGRAWKELYKLMRDAETTEITWAMSSPNQDDMTEQEQAAELVKATTATKKYKNLLLTPQPFLMDKGQEHIATLKEAETELSKMCKHFHAGGSVDWKLKLPPQAELKDLLAVFTPLMESFDGQATNERHDAIKKVVEEVEDFVQEYELLLDSMEVKFMPNIKAQIQSLRKTMNAVLALVMEGMMIRAIQNPVVKKQQGLLAHIQQRIDAAKLPRDMIHPLLADAASAAVKAVEKKK